jgi:hypothetical protein
MFQAFSRPSSEAQCLQWQPLVLPSYGGDSRAVFVVGFIFLYELFLQRIPQRKYFREIHSNDILETDKKTRHLAASPTIKNGGNI